MIIKGLVMRLFVIFVLFIGLLDASNMYKKIDDWDVNATKKPMPIVTKNIGSGMGGNIMPVAPMVASAPRVKTRKIGLSVGGAKDSDNFIQNIKNGYLPKLDSITYEGVFYDHYFNSPNQECEMLFCPSYTLAKVKNLYSDKDEYFISVGLDSGLDISKFKRDKLNLVVVLDVSGSMSGSFDRYYYDKNHNRHTKKHKTKMAIANETIVAMMKHLKPEDRFGVVLFDDRSYSVKPLRDVKTTDMKAISEHILDIKPMGGTNWSAGYKEALKYFKKVSKKGYENRIIFITDAMPNSGELSKKGLFGMTKMASKEGIHTTFFGVGVDFNANLVEYVSKVKGANYYSVHSAKEFAKRLDKEFDYMVTPLVYDLSLKLTSKSFKIDAVYGAPKADIKTGEVLRVDTLFASDSNEDGNKGGVILLKVSKFSSDNSELTLNVTYKDRYQHTFKNQKTISFDKVNGYENSAIEKSILLANYVSLMKNWIIDARAGCNDKLDYNNLTYKQVLDRCIINPIESPYIRYMKTWERKSCKLHISDGYKKLLSVFRRHFKAAMKSLHDKSLTKELDVLNLLLRDNLDLIDDWNRQ